jgi:hypothetical protein
VVFLCLCFLRGLVQKGLGLKFGNDLFTLICMISFIHVDFEGFWRWCMMYRTMRFILDFIHLYIRRWIKSKINLIVLYSFIHVHEIYGFNLISLNMPFLPNVHVKLTFFECTRNFSSKRIHSALCFLVIWQHRRQCQWFILFPLSFRCYFPQACNSSSI